MADDSKIMVAPVGVVRSGVQNPEEVPIGGKQAEVEIFPQYERALLRIEENSHLWLLLWFHKADRNCLATVPSRVNPNLPEYGVFGLRAPKRPNPIALTLVHLDSVEGNKLKVSGLDAVDGTPVLDVKSYYEHDIIFSPTTPYIRPIDPVMRRDLFLEEALAHHQEACPELYLGVRMALVADELMGQLNSRYLRLLVTGPACLADTLQGLSRARLANPPRFKFEENMALRRSRWEKPGSALTITARQELNAQTFKEMPDQELFDIDLKES